MAVQFHVSFSKTIKGAGITAGGAFIIQIRGLYPV